MSSKYLDMLIGQYTADMYQIKEKTYKWSTFDPLGQFYPIKSIFKVFDWKKYMYKSSVTILKLCQNKTE